MEYTNTCNLEIAEQYDLLRNKKEINKKLDKYYTKRSIAARCYENTKTTLNKDLSNFLFVEPSAGAGAFLTVIEGNKIGFDIAPCIESKHSIIRNDYLNNDIDDYIKDFKRENIVVIGNPPFGNKSSLAIQFLNKSFQYSDLVAFIVPIQFRKWSVQSKIKSDAFLIEDFDLPENSFEFVGKDYKLRCCFQIWSLNKKHKLLNKRILNKPQTKHPDFELYQFNRTDKALKYFDYEWDFAVPRQGYCDYSFKALSKEQCDKKKQWMFIKSNSEEALKLLLSIDYDKLSKKNISIQGYGKADLIQEYNKIKNNI